MLVNLLNIEAPVIAAVNGPVNIHADLAVLSDTVMPVKFEFLIAGVGSLQAKLRASTAAVSF